MAGKLKGFQRALKDLRTTKMKQTEEIRWRPYQEETFRVMDETKKHIFISMGRRLGKDFHVFYKAVQECLSTPNYRVMYMFPTINSARRAIAEGVTNNNERWLDAVIKDDTQIVKAKNGSYVHWDNTLYFKNGSQLELVGADNAANKVGSNINLVVMSEAAHYRNLKVMMNRLLPSVTKIGGRIVLISTPLYGSYFNRMKLDGLDKGEWYEAIVGADTAVEADGSPVYTQEELEMMKSVMSEEEYKQEMLVDFESANNISILGRSLELATVLPRDDSRDSMVYISADIGTNDNTVLVFSKQIGRKMRVIDMYATSGKPTKHYTDYIHNWLRTRKIGSYKVLLPHDAVARQRGFESTASTLSQFKQAGLACEVVRRTDIINGIEILRSSIQNGNIEFVTNLNVRGLMNKMKQYQWQVDGNGESVGVPDHGKQADSPSNYCDAVRYLAIYKFGEMKRQAIYGELESFFENDR